jgi:DNA-binding NtrC family response regulator
MSQERVLIVGDEENERTGLAELVSAWGYRAETARDGAEGFEKVSTWAPSIVVTDLKMPRMGGLELLERIADDSKTMAVIVVTAQGTIDSAVQAMRMGAYDYITKPIDTERLRTILQNASALLGTTRRRFTSGRTRVVPGDGIGESSVYTPLVGIVAFAGLIAGLYYVTRWIRELRESRHKP